MIDIRRLQLFVAVAEELHFGRAAARIGMAQPPFSQQIRRLERDLGVELLFRTSRRVSLTPAGEELLCSAQDLIAQRDTIVGRVKRTARGDVGTLRIGFAASSAIGILPAIVKQLREKLPEVVLHLDDRDRDDIGTAIHRGTLDVAIVREPFEFKNLVSSVLHSEPFVVVMPASHILADRKTVTPYELAGSPFILFPRAASPGLHDTIIGVCIAAGFSPVIVQEANAWLSVLGLVESGLGITIAPASSARICPPGVICIPILGTDDLGKLAIVHAEGPMQPLVSRFRDVAEATICALASQTSQFETKSR